MTAHLRKALDTLPEKELLPVSTVAEFFSVKRQTIYNWYNCGKLTGCNIAGVLRIYRQSVIELTESADKTETQQIDNAVLASEARQSRTPHSALRNRKGGWVKGW